MDPIVGIVIASSLAQAAGTYISAKSTAAAQGKKANSPAPKVKYSSPLSAFSIVIISLAVVLRFFKYTYDLV